MSHKVDILGVTVDKVDMAQAKAAALSFLEEQEAKVIFTPNSEMIYNASRDKAFAQALNSADLLVPDGIGVVWGSKILNAPLKERVSGFDLMREILSEIAGTQKTVYFFGSKPGVAEEAAKNAARQFAGLEIAGVHDGFFDDDSAIIKDINEKKPDFLIVCLGSPKQENWIRQNRGRLKTRLVIGAGGSLDVLSGQVERAPEFYRKYGLEWFYRLMKQPSRFVRMLALPKFGLKVLFQGKRVR